AGDRGSIPSSVGAEHFHGEDRARPADACNADVVVAPSRDDPCDRGTVAVVVGWRCRRLDEFDSRQYGALEIRVRSVDTGVEHRDDDVRPPRALPSGWKAHL